MDWYTGVVGYFSGSGDGFTSSPYPQVLPRLKLKRRTTMSTTKTMKWMRCIRISSSSCCKKRKRVANTRRVDGTSADGSDLEFAVV